MRSCVSCIPPVAWAVSQQSASCHYCFQNGPKSFIGSEDYCSVGMNSDRMGIMIQRACIFGPSSFLVKKCHLKTFHILTDIVDPPASVGVLMRVRTYRVEITPRGKVSTSRSNQSLTFLSNTFIQNVAKCEEAPGLTMKLVNWLLNCYVKMKAFRTCLIPIEFALDVVHPRLRCALLGNLLILDFTELFRMQSEHQLAKQRCLQHESLKSWRQRNWCRNTTSSHNQVLEPKRWSQAASEERQYISMNKNSQSKGKQRNTQNQNKKASGATTAQSIMNARLKYAQHNWVNQNSQTAAEMKKRQEATKLEFFFPAAAYWPVWPGQSTVSVGRALYRSI